jgi:zinc protease
MNLLMPVTRRLTFLTASGGTRKTSRCGLRCLSQRGKELRIKTASCRRRLQLDRWVLLLAAISFGQAKLVAAPQKSTNQIQRPGATTRAVKIVGPYLVREDKDEYSKVVLKNGLTVLLFERRDQPLVSILTYIKAGYLNELDSYNGISLVVEHLLFKRGLGRIDKETRVLGGALVARTSYDYTCYGTTLPAENLKSGLQIQADAVQHPTFQEADLRRELPAILYEAGLKQDDPETVSLEQLYGLTFTTAPEGRWRSRDETTLSQLNHQHAVDFYKRWYVPSNIVLVIAGSVDRRTVLDEVVKRYASMPAGDRVDLKLPAEPSQAGLRYREVRGDVRESIAQLGFIAPAVFTEDWYRCKVLEAALTLGKTSILNRKLQEELGLARVVSSAFLDLSRQSCLAFTLTAEPGRIERAEVAALAELERIKSNFLGEEDVERAKTLVEREYYLQQERLDELAFQLARAETLAKYSEWRDYVKRIRAVGREQVIEVARRYFSLNQCSLLEYLPGTLPPRNLTPEIVSEKFARSVPQAMSLAAPQDVEGVLPERKKPADLRPVPHQKKALTEIGPESLEYPLTQYSILRGPDVLVKESHALPLISIGLFFPGGRVFENQENNGITELMVRTSVRGTTRLKALRVVSRIENYGLRMDLKVEPDFFGYLLTGLSENVANAFETLWQAIRDPEFSEEQIEKEKAELDADDARLRGNRVLYPQLLFLQALYGEHPYGLPPYGSPKTVDRLTQGDLIRWHNRFVKRAIPNLVVAGDTEGSAFAAKFANLLSVSEASLVDITKATLVRRLRAPSIKMETRNLDQSALVLGFLGPTAQDASENSLTVVQNLIAAAEADRSSELRGKRGSTRVRPVQTRRVLSGSFSCYATLSPENEQATLDSLKEEFRRLTTSPISTEELVQARNYSVGIYLIDLQQRAEQVAEFARCSIFGNSVDDIKRRPQDLREVDQDSIKQVATKYLDLDRFALGILRASR